MNGENFCEKDSLHPLRGVSVHFYTYVFASPGSEEMRHQPVVLQTHREETSPERNGNKCSSV